MRFQFELVGSVMSPPFVRDNTAATSAVIEAGGTDLLTDVYARASAALGISVYDGLDQPVSDVVAFVDFARGPAPVFDKGCHLRARDLEIVDPDGTVSFGRTFQDSTVDDLVRTGKAGVMPGDISRPYFIAQVPGGGIEPWGLGWSVLVGAFVMVSAVVSTAANLDGALNFVERVRRVRAGSNALVQHAPTIEARNGRPDVFYELLGRRPWAAADLATVLGVDVTSAVALLELFGFEEASSGLWRRGTTADAAFLHAVLDEIRLSGTYAAGGNSGSFEDRIRYLVTRGERPPPPTWMTDDVIDGSDDENLLEEVEWEPYRAKPAVRHRGRTRPKR